MKGVDDAGLSQGGTVIHMGKLECDGFGVTNEPTELREISQVLIVVRGQAFAPLWNA